MSNLTEKDHDNMDVFLAAVLDNYKSGAISMSKAIGTISHVIGAVDDGNIDEARTWFEEGRKLITR